MKMRADKKKTVDAITAEIVKNPLATLEEIGNAIGKDKSNVSRNMPEVQQNAIKDNRIISLTDADFRIVQLTQKHLEEKLISSEEGKKISVRDLAYVGDVSAKRYSLLKGGVTDKEGGLNKIEGINYILPKQE